MRITYPSLLLLALTVASCGGGGGGPSSSSDQTSAKPAATGGSNSGATLAPSAGGLIEYYGDSTVWGCQSGDTQCSTQVDTTAPEAFAQGMPQKYSVDLSRNGGSQGVSGTTACELLEGRDGVHNDVWDTQMKNSQAKYVIINFGINDAVNPSKKYDETRYRSCLTSLARTAKTYSKQVVFETPNPISSGNDTLNTFVNAMKAVAQQEQVPVIDEYAYLTNYLQGRDAATICPDGTHPSQDIYILKGQYAAREFLKVFP
jgi:lysophospholipase L1-like esterase